MGRWSETYGTGRTGICGGLPGQAEVFAALLYFEEHRREIADQIRAAVCERRRAARTTVWLQRRRLSTGGSGSSRTDG